MFRSCRRLFFAVCLENVAFFAIANLAGKASSLMVRGPWSGDQGAIRIDGKIDAAMLDASLPVPAEKVIAETIFRRIDEALQAVSAFGPLGRVDLELENRVLHALTEVEARFRHLAKSAAADGRFRIHVVSDQYVHSELTGWKGYLHRKGGYESKSPRMQRANKRACKWTNSPTEVFSFRNGWVMASCLRC